MLSDPMDCSLPGSSVHGIFQARVLEQRPRRTKIQTALNNIVTEMKNALEGINSRITKAEEHVNDRKIEWCKSLPWKRMKKKM